VYWFDQQASNNKTDWLNQELKQALSCHQMGPFHKRAIRIMRLKLIIIGLLLLASTGCNSDPRCRRETALLRAEILDLEDKYFITKAQRDEALALLQAQGRPDLADKVSARAPINQFSAATENGDEYCYDDVIYEDGPFPTLDAMNPVSDGYSSTLEPSDLILGDMQLPARPPQAVPGTSGTFKPPTARETSPRSKIGETDSRESILEPAEELPETKGTILPQNSASPPPSQGFQFRNRTRNMTDATQLKALAASSPVTEIVIDRNQTSFLDSDSQSATLSLLLKPRDARGQSRRVAGTLTVSIVDPESSTARERRIGIWKFLPEEVELFFTDSDTEPGIRLSLPFENGLPQGNQVVVLARLQLDDGRALETTSRISASESPRNRMELGEEDQLAERQDSPRAILDNRARPAWRPVR
jgi:hypothetical protein